MFMNVLQFFEGKCAHNGGGNMQGMSFRLFINVSIFSILN
jgi:hypothetical protein